MITFDIEQDFEDVRQMMGYKKIHGSQVRHRKDRPARIYTRITDGNGIRHYIPYARMIMTKYTKQPIPEGCDVHHLDGNCLNDNFENLMILTKEQHREATSLLSGPRNPFIKRETTTMYPDKILTCPICHKEFLWDKQKQAEYIHYCKFVAKGPMCIPYCSKKCAMEQCRNFQKQQRELQNELIQS